MAYNPSTGLWDYEDSDSVEKRLTGLLSKSNPYMKQAESAGLRLANKRGLLSSSIAVGSAYGSALDRAMPIAQADANASLNKNLSRQGYEQQNLLSGQQITSAEKIASQSQAGETERATMGYASNERTAQLSADTQKYINFQNIASQRELALANISSNEALATLDANTRTLLSRESAASAERQTGAQISAQLQIAVKNIDANASLATLDANTKMALAERATAAEERLRTAELTSEERRAFEAISANEKLASADNATKLALAQLQVEAQREQTAATTNAQLQVAGLDANVRRELGALDAATQEKIAGINVGANVKDKAVAAAVSAASIYSSMINAINGNTAMPAAERDKQIGNARTLLDNTVALVEATYAVQLEWSAGGTPTAAPATGAAPTAAQPTATQPAGAQPSAPPTTTALANGIITSGSGATGAAIPANASVVSSAPTEFNTEIGYAADNRQIYLPAPGSLPPDGSGKQIGSAPEGWSYGQALPAGYVWIGKDRNARPYYVGNAEGAAPAAPAARGGLMGFR